MGVTGATGALNADLPQLLKRIKQYSGNVPVAVGFGISTREQFLSVASIADGVVIGSQIITTLAAAAPGERANAATEYCAGICGRRNALKYQTPEVALNGTPKLNGTQTNGTSNGTSQSNGTVQTNGTHHSIDNTPTSNGNHKTNGTTKVNGTVQTNDLNHSKAEKAELLKQLAVMDSELEGQDPDLFSARFGDFGGSYAPESLMYCLSELEAGFDKIRNDPAFWKEFRSYYP